MADRLRAAGVPEERIKAALCADGWDVPEHTPEQQAEIEAKEEWDQSWGFGRKVEASEYKIDYLNHGGRNADPVALANVNREATQFLAGMQIDPTLGAAVIERAMDVTQRLATMNPAQREIWKQDQSAAMRRLVGGEEGMRETTRLAAVALRATGPSELRTLLLERDAFNDPWLVRTLATQGERIERWKAGPKGKA